MSEKALGKADSGTSNENKDSSVECPTCGQLCKSKKGVRQHHTRTHNESIAKVTLECAGCGTEIKRWKSQLGRAEENYCTKECYHKHKELPSGGDHPNAKRVEVDCAYCGKTHERRKSRVERVDNLHCSRECADKAHSVRMSGDGNPRWEGGEYDGFYGANWTQQRKKALERDNNQCQYCGVEAESTILSVHHIQKIRKFKQKYDAPEWWQRANRLSNLVTLCRSCHGQWEGIPLRPQR